VLHPPIRLYIESIGPSARLDLTSPIEAAHPQAELPTDPPPHSRCGPGIAYAPRATAPLRNTQPPAGDGWQPTCQVTGAGAIPYEVGVTAVDVLEAEPTTLESAVDDPELAGAPADGYTGGRSAVWYCMMVARSLPLISPLEW